MDARVIDQELAHGARGDLKEACAVAPDGSGLVDVPDVDVLNESRGRDGVIGAPAPGGALRHAAEFLVDECVELLLTGIALGARL